MKVSRSVWCCALTGALLMSWSSAVSAAPVEVRVTVTNLAPANGTFLTPVWVGFHNGGFDLYDMGAASSMGLERIAEDGNTAPLSAMFTAAGAGTVQGTMPGPAGPIAPGQAATMQFTLDNLAASSRYFSYASMIIPSNDAFIANGNPMAHRIFADNGTFQSASFLVLGSQVLDAGTEVNDEIPANTAFFGQSVPDTGVAEGGVVHVHPGFKRPGAGGILDASMFSAADFIAQGYQVARVDVAQVPEPSSVALAALGLGAIYVVRRRRG